MEVNINEIEDKADMIWDRLKELTDRVKSIELKIDRILNVIEKSETIRRPFIDRPKGVSKFGGRIIACTESASPKRCERARTAIENFRNFGKQF